jgi:hypothetical protein
MQAIAVVPKLETGVMARIEAALLTS